MYWIPAQRNYQNSKYRKSEFQFSDSPDIRILKKIQPKYSESKTESEFRLRWGSQKSELKIGIPNQGSHQIYNTKMYLPSFPLLGIVYLLLMYGVNTQEACSSDPVYLLTRNPFTLLLGHEWTYVATEHSLSHQAMTQASDQLHTTSFCSPPVLATHTTHPTHATCNRFCS